MQQRDDLRAIQLQQLHGRMDRALAESTRSEGADSENFMPALIGGLPEEDGITGPRS